METGKTGPTGTNTVQAVISRSQKAGRDSSTKMVGKTYAAVAAAPKPITKSVAVNTELTWHSDDAKYNKLSNISKTEKQVQRYANKQKDKTLIQNKESQKVSLELKIQH